MPRSLFQDCRTGEEQQQKVTFRTRTQRILMLKTPLTATKFVWVAVPLKPAPVKDQSSPPIYSRPMLLCMCHYTRLEHNSEHTPHHLNSPPKLLLHTQFKMNPLVTCLDTEQWEIATEVAKRLHWIMNLSTCGLWQEEYLFMGHTLNSTRLGRFIYTTRLWSQTAWFTRWLCSPPAVWPQRSYGTSLGHHSLLL